MSPEGANLSPKMKGELDAIDDKLKGVGPLPMSAVEIEEQKRRKMEELKTAWNEHAAVANTADASVGTPAPSELKPAEDATSTLESKPESAKVDISISPELEPEVIAGGEHTPKEWREKLKESVEKWEARTGKKLDATASDSTNQERPETSGNKRQETVEGAKRPEDYLAGRSAELDAEAKRLGISERLFRSFGEKYNKLGWKAKLGIGVGLGVGAAAFSGVSAPLALLFAGGLGAQRLAGMASMFMKIETNLRVAAEGKSKGFLGRREWYKNILSETSEKQRKITALIMAATYTGGMSYAITEAVHVASESSYGEAVHDWLKHHYPFGHVENADIRGTETAAPTAETVVQNTEAPNTEAPSSPEPVHQPEVTEPTPTPEASTTEAPSSVSEDLRSAPEGANASASISGEAPVGHDTVLVDNLAAKEWGAEYAESGTAPETAAQTDLSAQEWRAEYAEPQDHTGTPDWRAEHLESETVSEAAAEAPASAGAPPAPAQPEASPAPAPEVPHLTVNAHGLPIDEAHAGAYLDAQKNLIVHGGGLAGLDERAELAKQLVAKDHSSVVYFDSTRSWLPFWHHVSKAYWIEGQGINIVDETTDATLQGVNVPGIDDLKEVYKPETGVGADSYLPPRADMPTTAPSHDDIPRADMPAADTGDGLSRPEMQLDKQHIPSGPEMTPHALGHIESGSIRGEFGYSPDGAVTSFNYNGMSTGEFKTLLADDYGKVLLDRPGNHGLARSVVENKARDLFNRTQILDELVKKGAGESPEANFLRRSITFTIEQTEKMYGNVFKDMRINLPSSGSLRDE